jgi:protein-tyrosine phosphatase
MTRLLYPKNHAELMIQTAEQSGFRRRIRTGEASAPFDWLNLQRTGEDCSVPPCVEFFWETARTLSRFSLSDRPDFAGAYVRQTTETSLSVANLRIGQTYYWKVNDSEVFTFTTDGTPPRWIAVDGITNVRDNGGWRTAGGRRMKQGLIYRGSEMDTHVTITGAGIRTMLDELHIKTDLDLRGEAVGKVTESPLGRTVDFRLIPVRAYAEFLEDVHKPVTKAVFDLLADETAYPLYYHCWGGADRTGTIAYLLEALLGVPEDDLILDYELTSLSIWGNRERNSSLFSAFEEQLRTYDEDGTPQSRAEAYLLSCGVTPETIEKLRNNLLE